MVNAKIRLIIFFEAEDDQFYEDLEDVLELTPKKDDLFGIWDWNAKSRKSRDTWSNR